MSDLTDPLAQPCPKCGKPIGDHVLRDWIDHTNVGHSEVPFLEVEYEQTTSDARLCDTIDVRAMTTEMPPVGVVGLVEMHWQVGNMFGPARSVAKVLFLGSPVSLRAAGRLLRDSMNHAANVAEGKR